MTPTAAHAPGKAALLLACVLSACGAAKDAADAGPGDVRNTRYCEILLGTLSGATDVNIKVYSTEGLNDCPESAWSQVNATQIMSQTGVDLVILNGPRYWTIDSFGDSMLLNTTPMTIGGIEMRQAGAISTTLGDAPSMEAPYTIHTIMRNSEFIWEAGKPVYQLVDPQGNVYTMQSYSLQKEPQQTIDTLANLGSVLTPPTGWSFRTMVLAQEIDAKAVNETAMVTQDDYGNTYLQTE